MAASDSEPEFVVVSANESDDAERLELPTNAGDSTLCVQTLTRAFPHAHGLKYKNPATGAYRALRTDTSGTIFYKPADGWQDKVFIVISKQPQPQAPTLPAVFAPKQELLSFTVPAAVISQEEKAAVESIVVPSVSGGALHAAPSRVNHSSAGKKTHAKTDQNAKRRKLMTADSDDDGTHSSSSEKNGDKRLRPSSGRAASSSEHTRWNDLITPPCSELIILGLAFKVTEEEIKEYFEQYGGVSFVEIKRKVSGNSKGFGFIRMATFDGQMQVLKRANHVIGGRKCQVRVPTVKNGEEKEKEEPANGAKVFVGRLQERTTSSELRKYFTEELKRIDENASVLDVYIPKPFRAFAFVTFSNPVVAQKLVKKGNCVIDGSALSLQFAQPKGSAAAAQAVTAGDRSPIGNPYGRGDSSMASYSEDYGFDLHDRGYFAPYDAYRGPPQMPLYTRIPGNTFVSGSGLPPPPGLGGPSGLGGAMLGNHHHGSQVLTSGLETLNLNNLNPELVTALKTLMYTSTPSSATKSAADRSPLPLAAAITGSGSSLGTSGGGGGGCVSPPIFPPYSGGGLSRGGPRDRDLSPPQRGSRDFRHADHYPPQRRSGCGSAGDAGGSSTGPRNGGDDGWR